MGPSSGMQPNSENSQGIINYPKKNGSLLEQIIPLARRINCLDIEQITDVCVENIPKLVGVRFASLYTIDETNTIFCLQKANHPFPINKIVSINQNPPSPMVIAAKSRELILTTDINTCRKPIIEKSQRNFVSNYKNQTCAIVPLICQNHVVGVLNLADKIDGGGFNHDDITLIELFGQLVGASIGNVKLFDQMQHQATIDGLTGLVNHRTFYNALERELFRCKRYGGLISLIMIDIDNLKEVNDVYGHRAGDKVVRAVSEKIRECIRQIDTAARYGGDEFAVILPNTSLDDAFAVAERMMDKVGNSPITWKNNRINFSISIGLGQYDANTNPEDAASSSDNALYMAKHAGKSTIRIFEHCGKKI
jgi:diguanylate cyclase (GGDEF)-like protein